jgi:hypothetical protein
MPFASGYITGIVKDATTGLAIQGVAISTSGNAATTPSGSRGEYLISDTEGTYTMWAQKSGYKKYTSQIVIVGSVSKTKNFSMKRA